MSIWKSPLSLEKLNETRKNTLASTLDINFTEMTDHSLTATMPVSPKTCQYMGILHGGASVALAETVASAAGMMCVEGGYCVGLDINANHIRAAKNGLVTAVATPFHIGKSTQVWEIKITDDSGKLVCISRLTLANQYHAK